jgi:transcriptional regulator with XRE-family HTH domain
MKGTAMPLVSDDRIRFSTELRRGAGRYLRSLRDAAEITQDDAAKAIGYEFGSQISRVEVGLSYLNEDRLELAAKVYGANPEEFAETMLQYYSPYLYKMLGGKSAIELTYPPHVVALRAELKLDGREIEEKESANVVAE